MATIVVLVCLAASFNLASSAGLHTTLTYSGSYQININNRPWFTSQETYVVSGGIRYSNNGSVVIFHGEVPAVDKPLLLKSAMLDKDHDVLGEFQRMRYEYFAGLTKVDMDIRAYDDMVVFTQTFPEGLTNVQVPDERKTLTGFPALHWEIVFAGSTADGYLTFSGELRGDDSVSIGKWPPFDHYKLPPDGMDASGPLCLFNTTGRDAVVISPLTQVMAVSPWHHQWKIQDPFPITEAQSYWGLDRDLVHVPAGFKVEVILVYSPDGVGKALEKWGQALRRYHGTFNASPPTSPFLDKFGYWTGHGSFYYNNTGNETYEDVVRHVDGSSTPLGFTELDNWWYQSGSTPEAVVTWAANNRSLPHGLSFLEHNVKSLTLVLSCGWWSSNTTYAEHNNGSYAFIVEEEFALPVEKRFWVDLFHNVSCLNVTHVYMDAMAVQYYGITALRTRAGMADDWLKNLTSAANETGVTLTFSGVLPRMLLAAAQYPSVVQALVTAPYMDKTVTDQWKIGVSSALADALGLAAFKGAFWSYSTADGNPYGRKEPFPVLQMAIATLSMGSVASGDKYNNLGSPPTTRIVRGDWSVLRPSKAATAIDAQIIYAAKNSSGNFGQIWTTVSTVPVVNETARVTSSYTMGILLAAEVPRAFNVTPSMLFPGVYFEQRSEDLYVWNFAPQQHGPVFQPFSEQRPLTLPDNCWMDDPSTDCMYYVSPAILQIPQHVGHTSVHLLGEGKFVPLSPQRVRYINLTNGVALHLQGQPDEYVSVAYHVNHEMRLVGDKASHDGTLVLRLNLTSPLTSHPPASKATNEAIRTAEAKAEAVETATAGVTSVVKYSMFAWCVPLLVVAMRCFANS